MGYSLLRNFGGAAWISWFDQGLSFMRSRVRIRLRPFCQCSPKDGGWMTVQWHKPANRFQLSCTCTWESSTLPTIAWGYCTASSMCYWKDEMRMFMCPRLKKQYTMHYSGNLGKYNASDVCKIDKTSLRNCIFNLYFPFNMLIGSQPPA